MKEERYTGPYIKEAPQHLYIAPDPRCASVVAHYTILHPTDEIVATEEFRILPDASGCLIFQGPDNLDFWGPMQELVTLENDANEAERRFFVEFHPGGLYAISGIPLASYKNCRACLQSFSKDLYDTLYCVYQSCESYDDLILYLNEWIYEQMNLHPLPERVILIKEQIDASQGSMALETLAEQAGISLRQIRRDFAKYIGLSPKEYANVVRINHLVQMLSEDDLISTALQGGFFDQAHFNKMFKQILQVSPSSYMKNISDFYREIYKF